VLGCYGVRRVVEIVTVEPGVIGVTFEGIGADPQYVYNAAMTACAAGTRLVLRDVHGRRAEFTERMAEHRHRMTVDGELAARARDRRLSCQSDADADVDNFGDAP
jgi:hypothetical protein